MRLFLSVVFTLALSVCAPAQEGQKKGPPPAPKNLKLLQPSDIRPMMGAFRTALGVECTFCHVKGDFASDENGKKETARHMIEMTREINKHFPDDKMRVTCYTCHRGAHEPATAPPAAAQ
jgi:photosynthetic reaction center cytochrome c subunit